MAASKKIDIICIVVTVITLILVLLFMNGSKIGVQAYSVSEEVTEGNSHFSASDLKTVAGTEDATVITLEGDSAKVTGNGAYYANGKLTMTKRQWPSPSPLRARHGRMTEIHIRTPK